LDAIRAINHGIFNYLRTDEELAIFMGNSNIHEGLASRSSEYPYIVFAINPSLTPDTPVIVKCDFQIDIWDKPDNNLTTRINEIRGRLVLLLDQHIFILSGGEAKGIRTYLDSYGIILRDPDAEFVQHMVTLWSLRFVRSVDLLSGGGGAGESGRPPEYLGIFTPPEGGDKVTKLYVKDRKFKVEYDKPD